MTKTAATHIRTGQEITVKGTRMVVATALSDYNYTSPEAKRMTNLVGFSATAGVAMDDPSVIWVAAHVKVELH